MKEKDLKTQKRPATWEHKHVYFDLPAYQLKMKNHSQKSVSEKFPARVCHPLFSYQPANS